MSMPRPIRTVGPLRFSDLDAMRFEDLCLSLLYSLHPWSDIRHYGRLGSDGGVDIQATERLEDGSARTWFIQCRRYKRATASVLKTAVKDVLAKAEQAPDVLLVVVACDVRRENHEKFEAYARGLGVKQPILWTQSILEAKLYAERKDLLFSYFDVSLASEAMRREQTLRRGLVLKRRLQKELTRPIEDPRRLASAPYLRFSFSNAIIHSIDDSSYPRVDRTSAGITGWFRLEPFDFYHNGIEFILRIEEVAVGPGERWSPLSHDHKLSNANLIRLKVWYNACIPYRNIVEVDVDGDEYYNEPHFYCRFAEGGKPYEEFRYRVCGDDQYPSLLDPDLRCDLEDLELAREPALDRNQ